MYQFTDDCLIGISEIDEEHRGLFQLINEAFGLLKKPVYTPTVVKVMLADLTDYALNHFAHEEAYMEKINDPELSRQRKEHAAFTAKIKSFDPDALTNDTASDVLEDLLTYLVRWLYRHILSSDMMIGKLPAKGETAKVSADPFAFTDNYRTGIELVDDEHQRLFEIIREVNELVHAELLHDKFDEIMRILEELKDYTEVHFQDEEAYMESINYPELDIQKLTHAAFIERLVDIDLSELDEIDDNQQEYLKDLIEFLLGWLSNHILKMDKKIGEFAKTLP